jgi:hypothetical protein
MLVIFKLVIGWKGVETMDAIYWVNCGYKLIIYRYLQNNIISVIKDNAYNNLPSLHYL